MKIVHATQSEQGGDPDSALGVFKREARSSNGKELEGRAVGGDGQSSSGLPLAQNVKPRDDQFYLRSAIFEVEDVLFQLPIANFVQESEVFKTLFEVPQPRSPTSTRAEGGGPNGDDEDVEGATDTNPIRLAGVRKDDFKNLVRVMYARYVMIIVSEEYIHG